VMLRRPDDPINVYLPMREAFRNPLPQSIVDPRPKIEVRSTLYTLISEKPKSEGVHLPTGLTARDMRRQMQLCRIDEGYLADVVFQREEELAR